MWNNSIYRISFYPPYNNLFVYAKYCISENKNLVITKYKKGNVMSLLAGKKVLCSLDRRDVKSDLLCLYSWFEIFM